MIHNNTNFPKIIKKTEDIECSDISLTNIKSLDMQKCITFAFDTNNAPLSPPHLYRAILPKNYLVYSHTVIYKSPAAPCLHLLSRISLFPAINLPLGRTNSIFSANRIACTSKAIKTSWKTTFTDPCKHNPKKFCYHVHALSSPIARIHQLMFLAHQKSSDNANSINLDEEPHRLGDRKIISTSVINESHMGTFASQGIILSSPFKNIKKIGASDLGTNFSDCDSVINSAQKAHLTVAELLEQTSSNAHNEVVLQGTTTEGSVELKGFWIKVDDEGTPLDSEMAVKVSSLAAKYCLPLIQLTIQRESYPESPPEFLDILCTGEPYGIAYNHNGERYLVTWNDDILRFKIITNYTTFATRKPTNEDVNTLTKEILNTFSYEEINFIEKTVSQVQKCNDVKSRDTFLSAFTNSNNQ